MMMRSTSGVPVNSVGLLVVYPLLRVEITEIEIERAGDIPPSLLRPVRM
jgi:hypothetical protein